MQALRRLKALRTSHSMKLPLPQPCNWSSPIDLNFCWNLSFPSLPVPGFQLSTDHTFLLQWLLKWFVWVCLLPVHPATKIIFPENNSNYILFFFLDILYSLSLAQQDKIKSLRVAFKDLYSVTFVRLSPPHILQISHARLFTCFMLPSHLPPLELWQELFPLS